MVCFFCEFPWYEMKTSPLLSGFNPFEKYARQIASLPQGWSENKKHWKPPPIDPKQLQVCRGLLHQPTGRGYLRAVGRLTGHFFAHFIAT